jgi:uncharacterized delta-60 repeat protein
MLFAMSSRSVARLVRSVCTALAASVLALAPALAQLPSAADGFDPDVDGNVYAVATQPDGKLIVAGQFSTIGGTARTNVARLNLDGTVDPSFNPVANGPVRAILIQRDNRIVLGGDFTTLQPGGTGAATARNRLARLNADGSLDTAFNPNVGGQLQPQVHALMLQADNRIVAGGSFTTVQPNGAATATTRNYLARFNADGSLDATFNPNPNSLVLALALHVDNKILVGGGFTSLQPAGAADATTRNRIARLNLSGTVDSEFNPNANNGVTCLAVQRDGKILLAGFFTTLQPPSDVSPAGRSRFARLNVDGTLDSEFYPRADGSVSALAVQPDGTIVIGGTFTSVWGLGASSVSRSYVARFNPDGSLDSAFAPSVNGAVNAVAIQADGKLVIGGVFTRAFPQGATTAIIRNHLARLNADGSLDTNFELEAGGRTLVSVTQADGKVLIGGSFTSVGGSPRNYVARLNADGSLDTNYKPEFDGRVYTMALQPDGKVIVGGAFTTIGGEKRNYLARLNTTGTIDSEFNPHFDGQVGVVVLLSDGRMLVGGSFMNVQPTRDVAARVRASLLRLNANGTLDTTFDPEPNSSVAAIAVQSDGKIVIGGSFSAIQPGGAPTVTTAADGTVTTTASTATITGRNFMARLNADGTLDTTFNPNFNGAISTLALQSDGKILAGGAFTALNPDGAASVTTTDTAGVTTTTTVSNRSHLVRLNLDGTVDATYNPNANGNVLAMALQSDGKLIIGGSFTTLQPNAAADWTLRKYAARLNTDGTVDATYNLDLSEAPGNRVDSLRLQSDGRLFIGGNFTSLQPIGAPARIARRNFARLLANTQADPAFDATAGGVTGAIVNALAVQPDGRVIAAGSFTDLGGAKSTNIARFRPEGTPDPEFSAALSVDGPVATVIVRPFGAPVPTQLGSFAWLNANGTLYSAFSSASARLSGEINAVAVDRQGRLLLGGTFANLSNTTGGNLVRFAANGTLDTSFNPSPNGAVTGIVVQADNRIVVVGSFTTVSGTARNRIARIDDNGSLDVTFDPNASDRIAAIVLQADGRMVVGGAFTSFTPNLTTTSVTRSYLALINVDGTVDANYNPTPNYNVNTLALQSDGKVVAGGSFSSVSPNGATTAIARNALARFNTDGTLDQNFNPNPNAIVDALVALGNGQFLVGGAFTTLQPNATGTAFARNNLARINSDGAVDQGFNPNPNAAVTTLAVQPDGGILVGGVFSTLQPNATGTSVTRNRLARLNNDGTLDLSFNPDIRGTIAVVASRPNGTILVGGNFTDLQLNGSIMIGGNFATIGGVAARNLAMLNDNGSVTTTFQPRPDGVVNALLALPDGKTIVGGAFTNIAGATRNRLARFNADGTLDSTYTATASGAVRALALQTDGRVLVGHATGLVRLTTAGAADTSFTANVSGTVTSLAVQADGKILYATNQTALARLNADGSADNAFTAAAGGVVAITLQADGRIVVGGAPSRLVRLNANGSADPTFTPAPDGAVTALAFQTDGRLMVGGGFRSVGGGVRPGVARLSAVGVAAQTLGVAANRGSVVLSRSGTIGEVSAIIFEQSSDRATWTRLGDGVRAPGTANWQVAGLNLPASGVFFIRARSLTPSSAGTSSGIYETVREFNYASPVPGLGIPANVTTTPVLAASQIPIDVATGIIPRSILTVVPGEGTVEILVGSATQASGGSATRLANLSTRGRVTSDTPLILGFAIAGTESRSVLVRGVGPALNLFGVSDALPATRLQVYDSTGGLLSSNQGWSSATDAARVASRTGAFPLTSGSADSAAVLNLAPGIYTLQVDDPRGNGGVALAEIYDAGNGAGARLVNVSSRGAAGIGGNALISGFVLEGGLSSRLLLRGVGPGLTQFGATHTVADPVITLFDSTGQTLGSNDNWVSSVNDISTAALRAGAFALTRGSKDAAVLATLPSGVYTIQVTSDSATAATALLEIYQVP